MNGEDSSGTATVPKVFENKQNKWFNNTKRQANTFVNAKKGGQTQL